MEFVKNRKFYIGINVWIYNIYVDKSENFHNDFILKFIVLAALLILHTGKSMKSLHRDPQYPWVILIEKKHFQRKISANKKNVNKG